MNSFDSSAHIVKPRQDSEIIKRSMEEHKFPFDLDADLRREVKLEVEQETLRLKFSEIRTDLYSVGRRFAVLVLLVIAAYVVFFRFSRPAGLIVGAVASLFSWFGNFPTARKLFLAWRAVVNAKKELQSWDGVADDYRRAVKRDSDSQQVYK